MSNNKFSKEVRSVIKPPIWDSCYYVNNLLRKSYEKAIAQLLDKGILYNILDYGCGVKPYKYLFENNIKKYIGVDIDNNPKAEIIINPGEKLPVIDSEYDIVLSSQVLEHVLEVDQYMNECNRVLKKDGHLILSTHGTWQYHASPYDFNRWTYIGLNNLIEKHGFKVLCNIPVLGQLALTSQLRLTFFHSFANMIGIIGKLFFLPISLIYQFKMMIEDLITPKRVKERDSAIFLIIAVKL